MLFHKKEKALEGQLAGIKPEKPRKVRWSERREPSEAGWKGFRIICSPIPRTKTIR